MPNQVLFRIRKSLDFCDTSAVKRGSGGGQGIKIQEKTLKQHEK